MIRCVVFAVFLIVTAWQDLRRMEIDLWVFGVFGAAAAVICADTVLRSGEMAWQECLAGGIFGAGILLVSCLTGGGIGAGDALFFVVAGCLLGFRKCLSLFLGATFLCGIYSLCLYTYKKIRYNIRAGKELLPFLPFVALTGLIMFVTENR